MDTYKLLGSILLTGLASAAAGQSAPMPDISTFAAGDRWEWVQYDNRTRLPEGNPANVVIDERGTLKMVFDGMPRPLDYPFVGDSTAAKPWRVWPLTVGKTWSSDWSHRAGSGTTTHLQMDSRVVAYESVTVKAGTFMAFRIEQDGFINGSTAAGQSFSGRMTETFWYAPDAMADVKHVRKFANADFSRELVAFPDKRQAKAPAPAQAAAASPAGASPGAATTDSPAAKRLRELEQLRKEGLISPAEYEEKRRSILSTF